MADRDNVIGINSLITNTNAIGILLIIQLVLTGLLLWRVW